ncbi:uncharacterized protein LOC105189010 [Harpegnathos saltator]|uniref:uncharacterized protein LOC105189010 n=1 Tax=Harpegnathos saltator TaxID=610380 RepID=UPI00058FF0CA|nr:uncharacterized protein LOC105189010 [Harpegnathos saltator]
MASIEGLLAQQKHVMNTIHRALPNLKKLGKAKWTIPVVRQRLASLKETFTKCQELDIKLNSATEAQKANSNYFSSKLFYQCEDYYNEATDFMAETLGTIETSQPSAIHKVSQDPVRPSSHLPRLDLPTFDGTPRQWESYRDRFRSLIHQDRTLSDVERLHYLLSTLKGEALTALGHLALTDANFDMAWKILVSRYENKRRLITEHLTTLFKLPALTTENPVGLRKLRDLTNSAIQALKNLERPVDY